MLLEHGPEARGVEASIDALGHQVDELEESEGWMGVRAKLVFCTDGDRVHIGLPWVWASVCEGPKALCTDGAPPCQEGTAGLDPSQRSSLASRAGVSTAYSAHSSHLVQEARVTDPDCLFCKIVDGTITADIVAHTDRALAFRDINPQAPAHILVIPREHVASLGVAADEHRDLLGAVLLLARDVARSEGIAESGFRTVLNTGDDGGQSVDHVHAHVLGGRSLEWPPG